MPCDELPPLVDVDITGSHIENAARRIRGSCGPGGSTAAQWQCYLLMFGSSSSTLRDAVAELVRCLANKHSRMGTNQGTYVLLIDST